MNERPEAMPPENLPTGELSLAPDQGRNTEAQYRAEAIVSGDAVTVESAYKSSLQSGSDYNERMQASIAKAQNVPMEPGVALSPRVGEVDPVGDAIAEEIKKVEALTQPLEVVEQPSIHNRMQESWNAMQVAKGLRVEVPESERRELLNPAVTTDAQKNLMGDFAARNVFKADYERRTSLNPFTRVGNVVGSVAGKVGDKLAEWGGQIEAGELERAERELLAKRTPSEVMADRAETFDRWSRPQTPASSEVSEKTTRPERVVPIVRQVTEAAAPSEISENLVNAKKTTEETVRSYVPMAGERTSFETFEGFDDLEDLKARAEALEYERARLRLQQELIRVREQELILAQKEKALAVRLKKMAQKPVPQKGVEAEKVVK